MPSEAIEVLVEDAIASEIAKVGTEPLSNWLTVTQPQVFTEIPTPGQIPRPNLETFYVHHVGSQPGTDDVGLNYHLSESRYAIWCCSSNATDGRRRMLNLRRDCIAVLRGAEGMFRAAFKSTGITIDECVYANLGEQSEGGVYSCIQYVTVRAFDPDPDQLRFGAGVLSLDLEKTLLRLYPFTVVPALDRVSGGGGIAQRVEPPLLIIEASVPGANRFLESRIEGVTTSEWFFSGAGNHWWEYESEIACTLIPGVPSGPSATMYAGIEMGSYGQLPPFPASATNPVAQLRWNYGLQRFELVSGVSDGSNDVIVPLTGIQFSAGSGMGARCRLIYDPFAQTLTAIVNGTIGAQIRDPLSLPRFADSGSALVHGAFVATGGSASATMLAVFAACHCKLYNTTLPPATLWY